MNNSNNCDNSEYDYYSSIIEFSQNQNVNEETVELWKNKSFIKLMKVLERSSRKEFVKNAILLILSLFEEKPPDMYSRLGKNVDSLINSDKNSYISLLKTEFIDDLPN